MALLRLASLRLATRVITSSSRAPPCELVYYQTIAEQIASFDSHYFLVNLREQFALPNGAGTAP